MKLVSLPILASVVVACAALEARASFLIDPTGGTVLWNGASPADDAVMRGRALGFTFTFLDDEPVTTIDVSSNGDLNRAGNSSFINELSPGLIARIAPLWDDLEVLAGSTDSISDKTFPGGYAATWQVHQSGRESTRHAFQVALFGAATTIKGIDFLPRDIVFSYEQIGGTFFKDSAAAGLDFGDEETVLPVPGANPLTNLLNQASAVALPTSPGSFILFRYSEEEGAYQASTRVNRAPLPAADTRYVSASVPIVLEVLANDLDPDGNPLTVTAVTQGLVGNVTLGADGRITYAPGENFTGTDDFIYTVRDPFGLTATARVSLLPFAAGQGVFDGLLTDLPGEGEEEAVPTPDGVGYLKLALTAGGQFTGTLTFGRARWKLRGTFDTAGNYLASFSRTVDDESRGVTLTLHLDLADAARPLSGTVSDGIVTSAITATRGRYDARRFPAPQAGRYTAQIAPDGESSGPAGIGYALLHVNRAGAAQLRGRLGDGRAFSFGTRVRTDGTFPIHVTLPVQKAPAGSLSGLARFDATAAASDLTAAFHWFMPDTDLAAGFEAAPLLLGARYRPPAAGQRILPLPDTTGNATIDIGAGEIVAAATITPANLVTLTGAAAAALRLAINPASGLFSGSMAEETADDPPKILRRKIGGVFVLKKNTGGGFYLTSDRTSIPIAIGPPILPAAR